MTATDRRVTAGFGIAASLLSFVSFGLVSGAPKLGTGAADQLAGWIADNHGRLLVGGVIGALGLTASVAFLAGLRRAVREAETATLADVGLMSGVFLFSIVAVGLVALEGAALLAQSDAGLASDVGRFASASALAAFAASAAPTLIVAGTFAAAIFRTGALPRWVGWVLLVVGAIHVGALVSVARTGVLAPEGAFAVGAPVAYETWQLVAAIAMARRPPTRTS